jgi:hypothetical protein
MATQWQKKQQRKQIPLKRLIIFIIGITCIAVGTTGGGFRETLLLKKSTCPASKKHPAAVAHRVLH